MKPQHWTHWIAVGFGSGLAPKAPGTFGSLAALPLVVFAHISLAPWFYLLFVTALFVLAVYCAERTQRDWQCHDPGRIVIDEWVGLALSYLLLPPQLLVWLAGFVLFRVFDIIKPWPIRWFDRHIKGGFGNVFDDVLAGVFTCVVLQLYFWFV